MMGHVVAEFYANKRSMHGRIVNHTSWILDVGIIIVNFIIIIW
jgi:predicted short-subunit dehydrogenase-like oxidoreductase (DUF2520 family)